MFKAVRLFDNLPKPYPTVERKLPTVKDKGYDRVGGFTLRDKVDFMPQPGLQERLCACESNLIFLCGPSQMGKTYGMLQKAEGGLGKPGFTVRFINVRLQDGKKGGSIFRDAVEVLGNFAGCKYSSSDYPTFTWDQWNNSFQIIHSNFNVDNPAEYELFKDYAKKNQASLIMIDEATEMRSFKMFKYWFSRNRDSSGMKPQMVLSFNYVYDHFTNNMLKQAGYFTDDWYFNPKMNGVTKYFYIKGDSEDTIVWGNSPEEVASVVGIRISKKEREAGVTINQIVKSFTALTGEAAENLKLLSATGGENIGNLHNVGGKESEILLSGYAGPIDNEELAVSRTMVDNLFTNPINDDENMYATLDVSSGTDKNDLCPMVIWKGLQIIAIKFFHSESDDPDALPNWIERTLAEYGVPVQNFAFDATGIGWYLKRFKEGMPVTFNKRPIQEVDMYGNPVTLESYVNLRSQLLGKMKVLFERGEVSIALDRSTLIPHGRKGEKRELINVLFDEMNVFVKLSRNGKIYYRSKEEFKSKYHFSPDIMDAIFIRAVFELDARPKKQPEAEAPDDAYDDIFAPFEYEDGYIIA